MGVLFEVSIANIYAYNSIGSVTNNEMYSLGKFEITVEDGINFSPSVKMLKIRAGSDSNGNKALTSRP